jgi:hypothetical protein
MNRSLLGCLYGGPLSILLISSLSINKYGCHRQVLFLNGQFSSEAAWPNDMKLGKKHLWKILYRDYSFRFDPFTNMAAAVSEKIFKNRPIRNKNCLWPPCLLRDRKEMSNRNRGLSIDASYQVSVHLAKWLIH